MRIAIAVSAVLVIVGGVARAEEPSPKAVIALLETFGLKQLNEISNTSCKVTINADQSEIIENVSLLQKVDILNQGLSANELRRSPTRTSVAVAMQMAAVEIKAVYDENPLADHCYFQHNLLSADEYGNAKKENMFSYNFDRSTYKRINWEKFQSQNLMKVASGFKANPSVFARINDE